MVETGGKMDTGLAADSLSSQSQVSDTSHRENMQTGLFLQHFTNSVNRALHKQNCTCNGRLYTADELLSKSNTAIYGPGKSQSIPKVSKTRRVHLPPISGLDIPEDPAELKTAAPLKNVLNRELSFVRPVQSESLVTRSAPSGDEELRLPNIMDIRDTKGNTWKILQEPSGSHRHRGRKPLQLIKRMLKKNAIYNPDIYIPTDVNGNIEEEEEEEGDHDRVAIDSVLEANTPINSTYDMGEHVQSRDNDITEDVPEDVGEDLNNQLDLERDLESELHSLDSLDIAFPDLAPSVSNLARQIKGIRKSCHGNSDGVYHDENERKALLSKYSSDVRRRRISYMEYLHKVSQMTLCPCLQLALYRKRDKRLSDIRFDIVSAKRVVTAASRMTLKSRSLPVPDFASNVDTLSLYARGDQGDFTNELDNIYDRGTGIATLKISGDEQLPMNFLEREREELRLMYPMYDWRVQHNQHLLTGQLNRSTSMPSLAPTSRNVNDKKFKTIKPSKEKTKRVDNLDKTAQSTPKENSDITRKAEQSGLAAMKGHSVTLSSPNLTQQSSESLAKSRVPTQPPPSEQSVTIASASAPELLTINENEDSECNEGHADKMTDDNNNDIGDHPKDDHELSVKSEDLNKSNVSDQADTEQNVEKKSDMQTENIPKPSPLPKNVVDELKYAEQNSSVHHVSPASTASNSSVNVTEETPIPTAPPAVVRPSVKLLQIDAGAVPANRRKEQVQSGESESPKAASESAPKLRQTAGVARLATHKVVFVSPAATQA